MLAQTNPFAHSELIALGTLHGEAPGPRVKFEKLDGGALLGTASFPMVGVVENQGDTGEIILALGDSATEAGAYAPVQVRVNGALVNTITVPPKARVQFAVETLTLAKPFLQVSNNGLGWGRVGLHSFVGRITRHEV